jgi:hypothetical protein
MRNKVTEKVTVLFLKHLTSFKCLNGFQQFPLFLFYSTAVCLQTLALHKIILETMNFKTIPLLFNVFIIANLSIVSSQSTPCFTANGGSTISITCSNGLIITDVKFASYGTPTGTCGTYAISNCHAQCSSTVVSNACINRASCSIYASSASLGCGDPCFGTLKRLVVQVTCNTPGLTYGPTILPTIIPAIIKPTSNPSANPSPNPSAYPSTNPSPIITKPTAFPSYSPTANPSTSPMADPSSSPTAMPTPSTSPTADPSSLPTTMPTSTPSTSPTAYPISAPSTIPTSDPSSSPTTMPTSTLPTSATSDPSSSPTTDPLSSPTTEPTAIPSTSKTTDPSSSPSTLPPADEDNVGERRLRVNP